MNGVGIREIVALGVLFVAGLIGFMFLDPTASQGGGRPPGTVSLGEAPPATPEPSPTPLPPAVALPAPERWRITYFDAFLSGGYGQVADGAQNSPVVIDYPGAPFNDSRDDGWKVELSVGIDLQPGRYAFDLEYDCDLNVSVGQAAIVAAENPDERTTVTVDFVHEGGEAWLLIACEDTGGPTFLRWVDSE